MQTIETNTRNGLAAINQHSVLAWPFKLIRIREKKPTENKIFEIYLAIN